MSVQWEFFLIKLRVDLSSVVLLLNFINYAVEGKRVKVKAPPLIIVVDISLQLTTHLSTQKGWKAESAWLLADDLVVTTQL